MLLSLFLSISVPPSVAKCQSRPRKFIRRRMKRRVGLRRSLPPFPPLRMRRPLMQTSGDNSRRIDYSEGGAGNPFGMGAGMRGGRRLLRICGGHWRLLQLCRALRGRLLRNYRCRNIGMVDGRHRYWFSCI